MIMVNMPTQWGTSSSSSPTTQLDVLARYFMRNFAGRQNDTTRQSGEIEHGNWLRYRSSTTGWWATRAPQGTERQQGDTTYSTAYPACCGYHRPAMVFSLPWKGVQQFWVVFFLFFMTDPAIVLYLNQTPVSTARTRDYAYAGSVLPSPSGLVWVWQTRPSASKTMPDEGKLLLPPSFRSLRSPRADGKPDLGRPRPQRPLHGTRLRPELPDVLQESGNPIIYTNGDNDTFLWYNQETEGFPVPTPRTCNLSHTCRPIGTSTR